MLSFVCYLISAIVFGLAATHNGDVDTVWGLFFLALGHVFEFLPGVVHGARNRRVNW